MRVARRPQRWWDLPRRRLHAARPHQCARILRGACDEPPLRPSDGLRPEVAALTTQSYVLVAGETTSLATVSALIAAAKAKPGQLRFGSTGVGTGTHLGIEKFNLAAGINATHIPARGAMRSPTRSRTRSPGATTTRCRRSRPPCPYPGRQAPAAGVSSARRSSALPDVPTGAEAGVPGLDFPIWYGIWAPGATPAGVVEKLAQDIARALSDSCCARLAPKHGGEPMTMTQSDFARFARGESEAPPGSSKPPGSSRSSPRTTNVTSRSPGGHCTPARIETVLDGVRGSPRRVPQTSRYRSPDQRHARPANRQYRGYGAQLSPGRNGPTQSPHPEACSRRGVGARSRAPGAGHKTMRRRLWPRSPRRPGSAAFATAASWRTSEGLEGLRQLKPAGEGRDFAVRLFLQRPVDRFDCGLELDQQPDRIGRHAAIVD